VKSHIDEELHAHMGLDSYAHRLRRPTDDRKFPAAWPGSFVVELHQVGRPLRGPTARSSPELTPPLPQSAHASPNVRS
jgi:hypothetical protein